MTFWIIESRDPLIVRDGRPFGPDPGARAATLAFPFPSTIAGALRHKAGLDEHDMFNADPKEMQQIAVRGPLLVRLNDANDLVEEWLPPAPADALVLELDPADDALVRVQRLAPRSQALTNMPDGLALVGPREAVPNKVSGRTPCFWHAQHFFDWLEAPGEDCVMRLDTIGMKELATDARMHVSVDGATQTAREGALFQTRGLVFTDAERSRLALAATLEQDGETYTCQHFRGGIAPMGGERRLMRWSYVDAPFLPTERQQSLFDQIVRDKQCRVVLLTPAIFRDGYRPPLLWVRGGVAATVKAALVPRLQNVSGWDMAAIDNNGTRGRAKPTRRLAPAGSVYFVEWQNEVDVRAWLDATWMQCVSDAPQDCRDGFGLAVLGTWSDQATKQEK